MQLSIYKESWLPRWVTNILSKFHVSKSLLIHLKTKLTAPERCIGRCSIVTMICSVRWVVLASRLSVRMPAVTPSSTMPLHECRSVCSTSGLPRAILSSHQLIS